MQDVERGTITSRSTAVLLDIIADLVEQGRRLHPYGEDTPGQRRGFTETLETATKILKHYGYYE